MHLGVSLDDSGRSIRMFRFSRATLEQANASRGCMCRTGGRRREWPAWERRVSFCTCWERALRSEEQRPPNVPQLVAKPLEAQPRAPAAVVWGSGVQHASWSPAAAGRGGVDPWANGAASLRGAAPGVRGVGRRSGRGRSVGEWRCASSGRRASGAWGGAAVRVGGISGRLRLRVFGAPCGGRVGWGGGLGGGDPWVNVVAGLLNVVAVLCRGSGYLLQAWLQDAAHGGRR